MIDAPRRLFGRADPDQGNASCAAPEASKDARIDAEASPPWRDDSATSAAPVDEEIEFMRYLMLSMAAAY